MTSTETYRQRRSLGLCVIPGCRNDPEGKSRCDEHMKKCLSNESRYRKHPQHKEYHRNYGQLLSKDPVRSLGPVWGTMMRRCYDSSFPSYKYYGARGIGVCEHWHNKNNFIKDMSPRPDGLTLDRIDGSKGYSPENCRWATYKEQNRNLRTNRLILFNGKTKCLSEWAEDLGIPMNVLRMRLENNTIEDAFLSSYQPKRHTKLRKDLDVRV